MTEISVLGRKNREYTQAALLAPGFWRDCQKYRRFLFSFKFSSWNANKRKQFVFLSSKRTKIERKKSFCRRVLNGGKFRVLFTYHIKTSIMKNQKLTRRCHHHKFVSKERKDRGGQGEEGGSLFWAAASNWPMTTQGIYDKVQGRD